MHYYDNCSITTITFDASLPSTSFFNNTKAFRSLAKLDRAISYEPITIEISNVIPSNRTITTTINLQTITKRECFITPFDLDVMDAIYTIYKCGNDFFTVSLIARTICGSHGFELTEAKRQEIIESIRKLRNIRCVIDCGKEFAARKMIGRGAGMILDSNLLPVAEFSVKSPTGNTISGYRICELSTIYKYAEACRHIISFPTSYLETGTADRRRGNRLVSINRYLLKRIAVMKNRKNNMISRRITLERRGRDGEAAGLLSDLRIEKKSQWRDQKARLHKNIIGLLNAYVTAGYIKGYTVITADKKEIAGYDIEI